MKRTASSLIVLLAAAVLAAPPAPPPTKPEEKKPLTPEETKKALYTFGTYIAQRTPLGQADLSPEELATVLKGFQAAALGKPLEEKTDEAMPKVDQLLRERQEARGKAEKAKGATFLETAAKEAGAQKLPSGLIYLETKAGTGAAPAPTDTVKVHYKGTLLDGKTFDSSYDRGEPAVMPLQGVIPGWQEGIQLMPVGSKYKFWIPAKLAYGEQAPPMIGPNQVLVFEVELLDIVKPGVGNK